LPNPHLGSWLALPLNGATNPQPKRFSARRSSESGAKDNLDFQEVELSLGL
jgi:hypothetical protein